MRLSGISGVEQQIHQTTSHENASPEQNLVSFLVNVFSGISLNARQTGGH
jgi:hypothetical protein